jgi:preprotein translocase subunit SecG
VQNGPQAAAAAAAADEQTMYKVTITMTNIMIINIIILVKTNRRSDRRNPRESGFTRICTRRAAE